MASEKMTPQEDEAFFRHLFYVFSAFFRSFSAFVSALPQAFFSAVCRFCRLFVVRSFVLVLVFACFAFASVFLVVCLLAFAFLFS